MTTKQGPQHPSPTRRRAAAGLAAAVTGLAGTGLGAGVLAAPATAGETDRSARVATVRVATEQQLRDAVRRAGGDRAVRIELTRDLTLRQDGEGPRRGDLDVAGTVTVIGAGRTIDARGIDRIFDVAEGGRLLLRGVGLTGGRAPEGENGGAVRSAGVLQVVGGSITASIASGELASGGAISNEGGELAVSRTVVRGNSATRAGGGIEAVGGTTELTGVTLRGNETGAVPGNGGGLHLTGEGTVTVVGGVVRDNVASAEGGGLWNSADGTMTVRGTRILQNEARGAAADQGGGGLYNDGGSLRVEKAVLEDNTATGTAGSGGGVLNAAGVLTVVGGRIEGNTAVRAGGGIEAVAGSTVVEGTTVRANAAGATPGNGGGLHLTGAGTVEIVEATVVANTATAEGGGLWNSAEGTMTVRDSLIARNSAAGAGADQGGGGLYNDGGDLTVETSTVRDNLASGTAGSGGGLLDVGGSVQLDDTTFADNRSQRAGGAVETAAGTVQLTGVTMTGNITGTAPGNGGGLHVTGQGIVLWNGGTVTGNTASAQGGGLWNSATGLFVAVGLEIGDNTAPTGADSYNDGGLMLINLLPVLPG